jgi:exosortase
LIYKLTTDWSTNPQFECGFFVPAFILYLLARRWSDRPIPDPQPHGIVLGTAIVLLLALLLPIRVVQEANPDWRPLNWVHAGIIVGLSILGIAAVGGKSWARHFGLPFFLIFFCLPWTLSFEQAMVKELTGGVARVTVELLNLIGIPALQRGNIIDVAAGSVGVADACSGMRSLAGTLMASAFFGEYYRLGALRRLLLIAGGAFIAFFLNLVRTFFLAWRTAAEGEQAVSTWHDPAGYTIFLISFAALWFIARLAARGSAPLEATPAHAIPVRRLPTWAMACAALWLVGVYVLTEAWYRFREGKLVASADWTLQWPEESHTFRFARLPDEVRSILRYSEGTSAVLEWPDGVTWRLVLLEWEPGRSSAQLATMHRPDICLPAAGHSLISHAAPIEVPARDSVIILDGSVFETHGSATYVYRCLWEDRTAAGVASQRRFDMSIRGRVLSSWYGRRNLGQRLLQIAVSGARTEAEAREEIRRRLPEMIIARG